MCLLIESILRELDVLPGFNIGSHNLHNITYEDETMLIADTQKLQKLLQDDRIQGC